MAKKDKLDRRLELIDKTKRLQNLFMCGVSDRYSLLMRCGLSQDLVASLQLDKPPSSCVVELVVGILEDMELSELGRFLKFVEQEPMPPGIPEPK